MHDTSPHLLGLMVALILILITGQTVAADPGMNSSPSYVKSDRKITLIKPQTPSASVRFAPARSHQWQHRQIHATPPYGHAYGHVKNMNRHQRHQYRAYREAMHRHEKAYYGNHDRLKHYQRNAMRKDLCFIGRDGFLSIKIRD